MLAQPGLSSWLLTISDLHRADSNVLAIDHRFVILLIWSRCAMASIARPLSPAVDRRLHEVPGHPAIGGLQSSHTRC